MARVIVNLAGGIAGQAGAPVLLAGNGSSQVHLLLVATAERGLCGGFNSSISRLAREHIERLRAAGKTVKILCVGRKGRDALKRLYGNLILDTIEHNNVRNIGFAHAANVGAKVLAMYEAGEFDVCTLFYSRFRSVMAQIPTAQQIIPVDLSNVSVQPTDLRGAAYEYEPGEAEILMDLLPRNVSVQIFGALLENAASEQGARMSAMDSATRNAGEMIQKLTLTYNRSRQAVITKELIEIISGAEAL